MANPQLPDELKAARGTLRPSRVNKDKPMVSDPIPSAPDWLSHEEAACYDELVSNIPQRVGFKPDYVALGVMAKIFLNIKREGRFAELPAEDADEKETRALLITVTSADKALFKKFLDDFGMTPVARQKIIVAPSTEEENEETDDIWH